MKSVNSMSNFKCVRLDPTLIAVARGHQIFIGLKEASWALNLMGKVPGQLPQQKCV